MKVGILSSPSSHLNFPGSVSSRTIALVNLLRKYGNDVILYCKDYHSKGLALPKGDKLEELINCEIRFYKVNSCQYKACISAIYELQKECDIIHSLNVLFEIPKFNLQVPLFVDINYPIELKPKKNLYYLALCRDFEKKYHDLVYSRYIPLYPCTNLEYDKSKSEDYLLWLGRLNPEKNPEILFDIAQKSKFPIYIGGIKEEQFKQYGSFIEKKAKNNQNCFFLGFVKGNQKRDLIQNCKGLIYTCHEDWSEPSGTIFFEAMKCGKPVIGQTSKYNAINDYVIKNKTGFICDNIEDMLEGINNLNKINPNNCIENYEKLSCKKSLYSKLISIYLKCL